MVGGGFGWGGFGGGVRVVGVVVGWWVFFVCVGGGGLGFGVGCGVVSVGYFCMKGNSVLLLIYIHNTKYVSM